jgi:hypothetical protein
MFALQSFQRIRDLEDKTDIQRRQIKDLEEKVRWPAEIFTVRQVLLSPLPSAIN